MKRRHFLASPLALLSAPAFAVDDYSEVTAGHTLRFPRDYGSHPSFRNEWWYITGWVRDSSGVALGIQVTFFRNRPRVADGNPSRFAPQQLLFAHGAVGVRSCRDLRGHDCGVDRRLVAHNERGGLCRAHQHTGSFAGSAFHP